MSTAVESTRNIAKHVEFNPAWLDSNGFMTNLPRPNFLEGMDLPAVPVGLALPVKEVKLLPIRQAVGTYIYKGSRGDEVLRFIIEDGKVTQELPENEVAHIHHSYIAIYRGDAKKRDQMLNAWTAFINEFGGERVWVMTGMLTFRRFEVAENLVPATAIQGLKDIDDKLKSMWLHLGHGSDGSFWPGEIRGAVGAESKHTSMAWNIRPSYGNNQAKWLFDPPSASLQALWRAACGIAPTVLQQSPVDPEEIEYWSKLITDFIEKAVEIVVGRGER